MNRIFVILGSFLIYFSLGIFFCWGTIVIFFVKPGFINKTYDSVIFIFAMTVVSLSIFMAISGYLLKNINPQIISLISSFFLLIGICVSSLAFHNFILMIFTYGLLFGLGFGLGYSSPIVCTSLHFPEKKGLFVGIILTGATFGTVFFNFLIKYLANPQNLTTSDDRTNWDESYIIYFSNEMKSNVPTMLIICGLIVFSLSFIGSFFMKKPNINFHNHNHAKNTNNFSILFTLKSSNFYILWILYILATIPALIIIGAYGIFGSLELLVEDELIAILGALSAVFNGFGRIFWGYICDRIGYRNTMIIIYSIQSILLGIYITSRYSISLWFFLTCTLNFIFSANPVLYPIAAGVTFGIENISSIYGVLYTAYGIGGLFSAILLNLFRNNFLILFIILSIFSIINVLLIIILIPIKDIHKQPDLIDNKQ